MVINVIVPLNAWSHLAQAPNSLFQMFWHLPWSDLLAQTIKDPDILGSWHKAFDHFIQSGQVWALLIGVFIGFLLKSMTSFG